MGVRFKFPCCDLRYDFRIKTMFGASLPLFICRCARVLFVLFVLLRIVLSLDYLSNMAGIL